MTRPWPMVCGDPAADRLMQNLDYRLSVEGMPRLTRAQVAVVLHALADHTAIAEALRWRRPVDGLWPEETSVGRWFHDVADQLEGLAE